MSDCLQLKAFLSSRFVRIVNSYIVSEEGSEVLASFCIDDKRILLEKTLDRLSYEAPVDVSLLNPGIKVMSLS